MFRNLVKIWQKFQFRGFHIAQPCTDEGKSQNLFNIRFPVNNTNTALVSNVQIPLSGPDQI